MDKTAQPSAGVKQTAMKPPAKMRRKEMNVAKLARLAGPEEFVRFSAPQHVEFGGAFLQGAANRQCHQHQTDAVLPVSYTHLRAHETPEHLVCRLLLEK